MGTKQFDNYADLITFTRASGGTALRRISYGDELVTNGTFDSDTTGWTAFTSGIASSTLSVVNSRFRVTKTGTVAGWCYQTLTSLTVGSVYAVSAYQDGTSASIAISDVAGSVASEDVIAGTAYESGAKTRELFFVATATTLYVNLGTLDSSCDFDNISVKEVLFDQPNAPLTLFNHPNNIPRIEYDADGNRLGLLVEEQRTNLVTYSNFSAGWNATRSTLTTGALLSPDGQVNGASIKASTDNNSHYVSDTLTVTNGSRYTASVFAKAGGKNWFTIYNGNSNTFFDLDSGVVGSVAASNNTTAEIQNVGNGWFRCAISFDAPSTSYLFAIGPALTDTDNTYAGDNSTEETYIYGAQLEAGAFPTSYIPTSGSTATRAADVASIPTSAFGYNASEGTVVAECQTMAAASTLPAELYSDNNNRIRFFRNAAGVISFRNTAGGVTNFDEAATGTVPLNTFYKGAIAYKTNDFAGAYNGGTVVTDNSGEPATVDELGIGADSAFTAPLLSGHIKKITYYPRRLTNAQLQELTQ